MGKHLDWLTVELERASSKAPLNFQIDEVIEEVQSHIVSSQEALMELGLSQEAAEEEAVKRFGNAQEYVKSLADLYQPKSRVFDIPTMAILLAATVFTVFFICRQDAKSIEMWIGWGVFATLAVRRMWIVRRMQWSLAALFIPASMLLGIAYPLCWMNPRHEAMGHMDAAAAPESRRMLTTMIGQYDKATAELQRMMGETGLNAPATLQFSMDRVVVRTHTYGSLADAAWVRKRNGAALIQDLAERRTSASETLGEVENALATPLLKRLLLDFKIGPYFGLGWTVLMLAMNLVVAALRATYDRAKKVLKLA